MGIEKNVSRKYATDYLTAIIFEFYLSIEIHTTDGGSDIQLHLFLFVFIFHIKIKCKYMYKKYIYIFF